MDIKKGSSATKAKNKYNAQHYDNLRIIVPKGHKSEIMAVAEAAGDSLNGYVTKAIEEFTAGYKHLQAKVYTIIGGVNGSGKSSFTGARKEDSGNWGVIVDVDKITALNKVDPLEGGKIALRILSDCLKDGASFTQETTLAGYKTEHTAIKAKELGYFVRLYYIGLDTPEDCLKRIANRVSRGGHDIGEEDVRRRFAKRLNSVKKILPHCDEARFFDNDNGFVEVAEYINGILVFKEEPHPSWILELSEYLKQN